MRIEDLSCYAFSMRLHIIGWWRSSYSPTVLMESTLASLNHTPTNKHEDMKAEYEKIFFFKKLKVIFFIDGQLDKDKVLRNCFFFKAYYWLTDWLYNTHNCWVFSFTTWSLHPWSWWWSYSIEYCWSIIMMKLIFYAAAVVAVTAALLFNLNFSSSFFSWCYQKFFLCIHNVQSKGTHGQFFSYFSFATN